MSKSKCEECGGSGVVHGSSHWDPYDSHGTHYNWEHPCPKCKPKKYEAWRNKGNPCGFDGLTG